MNEFTINQKNEFIELCKVNFGENIDSIKISFYFDDEEEEDESIINIFTYMLDSFLEVNPKINSLSIDEVNKYFDFLFENIKFTEYGMFMNYKRPGYKSFWD